MTKSSEQLQGFERESMPIQETNEQERFELKSDMSRREAAMLSRALVRSITQCEAEIEQARKDLETELSTGNTSGPGEPGKYPKRRIEKWTKQQEDLRAFVQRLESENPGLDMEELTSWISLSKNM